MLSISAAGDFFTPTEVTQVTTEAGKTDKHAQMSYIILTVDYYCCDRALDRQCRDTCRKVSWKKYDKSRVLSTQYFVQELGSDDETAAIQRVITACGPPPTVRNVVMDPK